MLLVLEHHHYKQDYSENFADTRGSHMIPVNVKAQCHSARGEKVISLSSWLYCFVCLRLADISHRKLLVISDPSEVVAAKPLGILS